MKIHPKIKREMREWEARWQEKAVRPGEPAPDPSAPILHYDVYSVILAYAYDQETDPGNRTLVRAWATAFPHYANELLAVAFARAAMGWSIIDDDPEGD